ncbi:MAG: wax ester/triacylglycerol synthase family O-acyltransferase [Deltaproteobacteria bacterium]|nr:wax ester/triacylglycerol synthase family O-acyltransferase [Deltaproteobacteria bacterium]MBW2395404.1 wax ester/triacylglycerol synthase family O-acyltransferase [Deltaproteobacteria bacterium]
MAYPHYERLSALDATFLQIEDENCPMHVGAVAIFDGGPLLLPGGGFDIERFRTFVASTLEPRYRQRIAHVPVTNHPVWVDDPRFNLQYHVRHLSLPHPGDERQLKRLAGRVMSEALDRNKPLWELVVVEGLANRGFAVIVKTHHCMIDGVGSADLLTASMQLSPDEPVPEPRTWLPRPAPGPTDMLLGEARHRVGDGFAALRAARNAVARPLRAIESLREALGGLGEAMAVSMHQASPTPLNVEIGPHRRFDWIRYDLDHVKQVKNQLGGTVNDVVLANVAGGLRRFLANRGENVSDLDFRAMLPVNIRTGDESGTFGNRVAMLAAQLPLDEPDPRRRLRRVIETTRELKASKQAQGVQTLEEISEWGLGQLFVQFARLAAFVQPFNVVVTNVPGPQVPAYLLGAQLRDAYPLVPLYRNQALGIALFSYNGGLFWGLNADWDALPDLHELVDALAVDFEALRKAAEA